MKRTLLLIVFCALYLFALPVVSANPDDGASVPYFSRMPNYYVDDNMDRDFDEFNFITADGIQTVEGKKYQAIYSINDDKTAASALQIIRNYGNAVLSMSGTKLYDGEFPEGRVGRVATFKVTKGDKELWLDVNVYNDGNAFTVTLIEKEAMRQDITAGNLLNSLNSAGHVAVYLNFDTGRADIKPEHDPILTEVYRLLADNPNLKLTIEGHTDTIGAAADNKLLSEKRAQAVVNTLVQRGISPDRLNAIGYGYEKPIADNSTEEGRAKNRRVELVKR